MAAYVQHKVRQRPMNLKIYLENCILHILIHLFLGLQVPLLFFVALKLPVG